MTDDNRHNQPNILLIMADQLAPQFTGAYGHPIVQTPHLNTLCQEGIRYDAAYTPYPVCSPARACLMTGKLASSIGAYDNAALLAADQPTLAHYLSNAGYDTVLAGKMHFVGPDQLHGFRTRLTSNIYAADFSGTWKTAPDVSPQDHAAQLMGDDVKVGHWNMGLDFDEETHFRALEYLRAQGAVRQRTPAGDAPYKPFFLCVSYHHPHPRFWPPKEFWELYSDDQIDLPIIPGDLEQKYSTLDRWINYHHNLQGNPSVLDPNSLRRVRRAYYALVTYIDQKVGELIQSLAQNHLLDNTVVVFTSDHGEMLGERGMVMKRAFYEHSARVPVIIRLPDGSSQNTVSETPVSLLDLLPTFLDMAGVAPQERLPVHGESLLHMEIQDSDRQIFSENLAEGGVKAPSFMIRRGRFKYVYVHGHDEQLFDLEDDPNEWTNLASDADYQEVVSKHRERILERFDPEMISEQIRQNHQQRLIIARAMALNGTRWDVEPRFDPTRRYPNTYVQENTNV